MDCLRSFNFMVAGQSNFGPTSFVPWTIGGQNFWTWDYNNASGSRYLIKGYKNINIYKIELSGDINSSPQFAPFQCIIQNWSTYFQVIGTNSSGVGEVVASPNFFQMITNTVDPFFRLSKFQNSITFETPITSAKEIVVFNLFADGIANNAAASGQIGFIINFTVYYQYEGE